MIDKSRYEEEIRRHNQAMEKLSEAKEKWYENQVEKKNDIESLRRQLSDANADINATNKALNQLHTTSAEDHVRTKDIHETSRSVRLL